MQVVIGIDIGTEGTKVVAVDENGNMIDYTYQEYCYDVPCPGWVEQDPAEWWTSVVACLQRLWKQGVDASQVVAIGVTGQMHSPVILDSQMRLVRKSILWNDTRTTEICHHIDASLSKNSEKFRLNSILPGYTIPSLLWIIQNEPQLAEKIHTVILPKDYMNLKLTGVVSTDFTDASGTGIFDFQNRTWNWGLAEFLGIPSEWLPELFKSDTIIGCVHSRAAAETGLLPGIPVIAGAGDNPVSGVGTSSLEIGKGFLTIGTSGSVVTYHKDVPGVRRGMNKTGKLPLHVNDTPLVDYWLIAASSLSAGASLRWFRDTFSARKDYGELMHEASHVSAGAEGLVFIPHLTGTRSTHQGQPQRGAFLGLQLGHERPHFIRSIIEGVSFSLKECLTVLETELQSSFSELSLTGGAANSALWSQMLADVLNCTLYTSPNFQGAAFGVAMLAGIGIGMWDPEFHVSHARGRTFYPSRQTREYQSLYETYRDIVSDFR